MRKLSLLFALLALAMTATATAHAQTPAPAPPTCPPIDLRQAVPADPACDAVPNFKASFLSRVWTFAGTVDEVDLTARTLDMTTGAIENLPARFASQDDPIVDQATHVRFRAGTRVYDPDGRIVGQDQLAYAAEVAVAGRLVAPAKWFADEDGDRIPTIKARRITIRSYVADARAAHEDEPANDDHDDRPGPCHGDPTPADGQITSADVKVWIEIHLRRSGED